MGKNVQPFIDFTELKGIDNKHDPTRLKDTHFIEVLNIDIDDKGLASRRTGFSITDITTVCHSLWSNKNYCYFVSTGGLYYFNGTSSTLVLELTDNELSTKWVYSQLPDGRIFATNNNQKGFLEHKTWSSFVAPGGLYKVPMKSGHLCTYFNGRIYVAKGNVIWFSDPFTYDQMDERYNFIQMEGYITLLESNSNGLFVADGRTCFLKGGEPEEFDLTILFDYNAILHTSTTIDPSLLGGDKQQTGITLMWASEQGLCLGTENGEVLNITNNRYVMPDSKAGTSLFRINKNNTAQLITVLQN